MKPVLPLLKTRARLLAGIRDFFAERDILEVDVPVLHTATVTDPHLQAISAQVNGRRHFLQTSPEFFMKRLLADGSGSCYYLGKAFRQDEQGRRHRPEFTMLEWYRVGYNDRQLCEQIADLIARLAELMSLSAPEVRQVSYGELFSEHLSLDPHSATAEQLAALAADRLDIHWPDTDKSAWLDLLFSHCVEPHLDALTLVYDYPACQCALARLGQNNEGQTVAKRFEVFWRGVELANGYWELTDATEQAARFEADNNLRREMGLPVVKPDQDLLKALEKGLPDCSGVALGVDRLLMCLVGAGSIDDVLVF